MFGDRAKAANSDNRLCNLSSQGFCMGVVVLDVNIAESGYWYMWIQIAVLAVLRYRYSLFLVIGRSGKTDIDSGCFALFGARSC